MIKVVHDDFWDWQPTAPAVEELQDQDSLKYFMLHARDSQNEMLCITTFCYDDRVDLVPPAGLRLSDHGLGLVSTRPQL